MALITWEGFDHCSFAQLANKGFVVTGSANTNFTGRFSGSTALEFTSSGQSLVIPFANNATTTIGFAIKFTNSGANSQTFLNLLDAGTVQCGLFRDGTTGVIKAFRNTTGTVLGTGTFVPILDAWYFMELTTVISDAAGSMLLKINGTTDINITSVDTKQTANAFANQLSIARTSSGGPNPIFDDLYIRDDSTMLGDCRVETLFASSNNSVTWTPLSSTNASNVDETKADDDTTYNSSTTAAQVDLFNMTDLGSTPASVFGVKVVSEMRKDDAAVWTLRNKLKSGATTSNGASAAPLSTYLFYQDHYLTDPNTGSDWTPTNVNAIIAGYENV